MSSALAVSYCFLLAGSVVFTGDNKVPYLNNALKSRSPFKALYLTRSKVFNIVPIGTCLLKGPL